MLLKLKIFLFFLLAFLKIHSQVEEVNPPEFIKTITFKSNTNESELPVLQLGERLNLEFDALNGNEDDYYYVIEHYNFDWTPSILMKQEYLQGFDNIRIRDYRNSFNTLQIYSHYQLQIPNQQTRLKVSGNYLIKILDTDGELMFSRKFMVYKDVVSVGVNIKRSRDVRFIKQKQSVNFRILSPNLNLINPKQSVKTVVIQNNNLRNTINDLKPQFILGRELQYKYDYESSFWGGNEFLNFDNKDVRGATSEIQYIDLLDLYNNYLYEDVVRYHNPYTFNPDINGNFLITAINADDPAIEADYTVVHFSLTLDQLPDDQTVHIYGNYNNYDINDTNELLYNYETKRYEGQLLLKQGFYNYKYVIANEDGYIDEGAISGNFDITENNYKVLVYYRDIGERFDRIIGFGEGNSVNISN